MTLHIALSTLYPLGAGEQPGGDHATGEEGEAADCRR